jgi:uncharacterized damage-inducible protein DinB
MKAYLIRLYEYNHWANAQYFALFHTAPLIPERVQLLMSHVLVAQKLWLSRIQGQPDLSLHIWQMEPVPVLEALATANTQDWLQYLQGADQVELDRWMTYENFQKITYTNQVSDIVVHTANHATYHRAQMAVLFRQADIAPPNTDFITYAREDIAKSQPHSNNTSGYGA